MTPYRAISVFYHVASLNSVTAAAEYLHVTPSAVSQQIRSLEALVNTSLVGRSGRKIRLTEAGERYFEQIAEHVEAIATSTERVRGRRQSTKLSIRSTPTIATKWLLPRLSGFLDSFPDIDIRLDGTNEPTDFNRDNVDIEIRHGIGRWPGMHCEALANEKFLPVCSPDLAAAFSLEAKELHEYRLIHSVKAQIQWTAWFERMGVTDETAGRRLYFDRSHMAIDAAVLGLGVALESNLMMEEELRRGQLVVPAREIPEMHIATQWIVCPPAHLKRPQVRRFRAWIRDQARIWEQTMTPTDA